MKIKTLTAALACALPMTGAFAAALDRSGQSIAPFLQSGNYFEAGISILDPDVSGKEAGKTETRNDINNMAKDYSFGHAAIKVQPTQRFSFGILYDQPFGASASYNGDNAFVSNSDNTVLPSATLDGLLSGAIIKAIDANLNIYLPSAIDTGVNQQATAWIAAGQAPNGTPIPPGTPVASVENMIRNNPQAMEMIEAGATVKVIDTITKQVEDTVNPVINNGNAHLAKSGSTKVKVDTHALSLIGGFQPTENWNFYAGAVYQEIEGDISLRGQAYSLFNGYDAKIDSDGAWGWLAGFAYQIPEIALKASLTYRSEIKHEVDAKEDLTVLPALPALAATLATAIGGNASEAAANAAGIASASGTTTIKTPQSVNLDLQSGIMANTVAFANIRWVNWKDFALQPHKFGLVSNTIGAAIGKPNGFDLVSYSDDQWSVNAGVGRKLNDKWAGNVSVGWDSGAGNPVTTLGPTEGFWNLGVGIQYSPAENYFVAGGVKYFWLGDAKAQSGADAGTDGYNAEFTDNNAIAYGLKLGYRF